jgi:hypothetical protein
VREKGNKRMGGEDKRKTDRGVRERERERERERKYKNGNVTVS